MQGQIHMVDAGALSLVREHEVHQRLRIALGMQGRHIVRSAIIEEIKVTGAIRLHKEGLTDAEIDFANKAREVLAGAVVVEYNILKSAAAHIHAHVLQ